MFPLPTAIFLPIFALLASARPMQHGQLLRRSPHSAIQIRSSSSSSTTTNNTYVSYAHTGMTQLFPINPIQSWTTSSASSVALPLTDGTLNPTNIEKQVGPKYVTAPDNKASLQAYYAAGSFQLTHAPYGGISFYAPGPDSVDLTTAKEATFGYSILFEDGFDFVKGGKLPGLYGGDSDGEAVGCSGGSRSGACFSARLMWRTDGAGEIYTYLPPSFPANNVQCSIPPYSTCNPTYGASVGRGSFSFTPGQRTTVSERVRLNDVGQSNGELQLFVNGKSVINVSGLVLRDNDSGRIRGIQMQTFFGGSDDSWASPKDQSAYFSDFSAAITESL